MPLNKKEIRLTITKKPAQKLSNHQKERAKTENRKSHTELAGRPFSRKSRLDVSPKQ